MQDGMNKHKQCERCHKGDVLQQTINGVLPSMQYSGKKNISSSVLMIAEIVFNIITRVDKKAFDLSVSTYFGFCKVIESDQNLRRPLVSVRLEISEGKYAYMRLV